MVTNVRKGQHGLGFGTFLILAFLVVLGSILGLRVIPAYIQYAGVNKVFTAIAHDPDLQKASPREIRTSFTKRADIDYITAIKAEDIEIENEDGNLRLSASYNVIIPLFGNASLLLEFEPSSDK
jgi:hypothetical protein